MNADPGDTSNSTMIWERFLMLQFTGLNKKSQLEKKITFSKNLRDFYGIMRRGLLNSILRLRCLVGRCVKFVRVLAKDTMYLHPVEFAMVSQGCLCFQKIFRSKSAKQLDSSTDSTDRQ